MTIIQKSSDNLWAYVFPGQASQYVGMGEDFYEQFLPARELYQKAKEILDFDIAKISFSGPLEVLTQTQYTQPAVFVHSAAILSVLGDRLPRPSFVAGHSLGEYTALYYAGCLSFEEALTAVRERSFWMHKANQKNPGSMAAIIGLSSQKVLKLCEEAAVKGIIQAANFNSPEQIAISGELEALKQAVELGTRWGAKRAVLLPVGGAFHSPLMRTAQDRMREVLSNLNFNKAKVPVISNVTGRVVEPEEMKNLLAEQITKPVLWHQSIEFMFNQSARNFLEIGPQKVLQALIKKSFKECNVWGIDRVSDLEKLKNNLKLTKTLVS